MSEGMEARDRLAEEIVLLSLFLVSTAANSLALLVFCCRPVLRTVSNRYKSIIENKCTNAINIVKKNEAWEQITNEYNATAEVPRSLKQLQTAYLNMKRTTRKNVADENVKKYIEKKNKAQNVQPTNNDCIVNDNKESLKRDQDVTKTDNDDIIQLWKKLKKDEVTDKKEIKATGGGSYSPLLTDAGAQVLAIMGSQITPLNNNCDSATEYYETNETTQQNIVSVENNLIIEENVTEYFIDNNQFNGAQVLEIEEPSSIAKTPKLRKQRRPKILKLKKNTDLKQLYYKKKIECAIMDKKIKLVEYKSSITKQKVLELELKIKLKQFENMKD